MKRHVAEHLVGQLNALSRVATLENAHESQRMAKSLADALRYRVTRRDQVVRGATELAAVDALLSGVALRFGEQLESVINGRSLVEPLFLPHGAIMHFVENAIFHAFPNSEPPMRISLEAVPYLEGVRIVISDTGVGFSVTPELVEPRADADYGTIASTAWRLLVHYRMPVLRVESSTGSGTRVELNLPHEAAPEQTA
ncbi:MAG: hypothetical protein EA403_06640 [Spirochaetaceae bacterium]|nr:MAG: hypothetical protein EA403_06640 [Spirochaetaceae bacterium]